MTDDERIDLFSRRLLAGERVSEDDLFGIVGARAIQRGLVPAEMVKDWCRHCLAARVKLYGAGPTEAWRLDRRARLKSLMAERHEASWQGEHEQHAMTEAAAMVRRMTDNPILEDDE
jgi:hypothetical protein